MTADEFKTFDAPYVLGSLAEDDRDRFEAHLQDCEACVLRVAELWSLPAALALAPLAAFDAEPGQTGSTLAVPGSATATDDAAADRAAPLPATLLPRLLTRTSTQRRRRRYLTAAAAVGVAACLAGLGSVATGRPRPDPNQVSPQAVVLTSADRSAPLSAAVQVVTHDNWDEVHLWCTYRAGAPYRGSYRAVAVAAGGRSAVIGVWPGVPGQTTVLRVPTTFHNGEIDSVRILDEAGNTISQTKV